MHMHSNIMEGKLMHIDASKLDIGSSKVCVKVCAEHTMCTSNSSTPCFCIFVCSRRQRRWFCLKFPLCMRLSVYFLNSLRTIPTPSGSMSLMHLSKYAMVASSSVTAYSLSSDPCFCTGSFRISARQALLFLLQCCSVYIDCAA